MISLDAGGGMITIVTNSFGHGFYSETADKFTVNDKQAFQIGYEIGDNVDACIELLTNDWTAADVKAIGIDDGDDPFFDFFKIPIDVNLAVTRCCCSSRYIQNEWSSISNTWFLL